MYEATKEYHILCPPSLLINNTKAQENTINRVSDDCWMKSTTRPSIRRRWPNVSVMLAHRLRRWANIKPTFVHLLVCAE